MALTIRPPGQLVLLLMSVFFFSACSTNPPVVKTSDFSVPDSGNVYIVRQSLHTGFVVPASIIQSHLPQVYDGFEDSEFIEFGWGDKEYYQAEEVTFSLAMRALVLPTRSVIRTVGIPETPEIHFADNEREVFCLDSRQYSLLLNFIENSFSKDSNGLIINSKDGADDNSQFYEARGTYSLFNTCNNWIAKGLKSAGLNISPAFKITAGSIMNNLSKHHETLTRGLCDGRNRLQVSGLP